MPRHVTKPKVEFELTPAGTHLGILYRIIDLGTQHGEFRGKPKVRKQVLFSWELPQEKMKDGRPFSMSKFYTQSLDKKATLLKHLEAWRSRPFTGVELSGFDLERVLKAACLLSIKHDEAGEHAYVDGVMALPKGIVVPPLQNKPFAFFLDDPWDPEKFAEIPEGIQRMILMSDEMKKRDQSGAPIPQEEPEDETPSDPGDDGETIPF